MASKKKKNKKNNETPKEEVLTVTHLSIKELKKIKYTEIKQAYNLFVSALKFEPESVRNKEHFWVLGIDAEEFVVCVYMVSLGSSNVTLFSPAEVFQYAINRGCTQVILAHNHPNETVLKASEQDIEMTNFLYHAARFVGINVLDHLIINLLTFLSLHKIGEMQKIIEDMKYKTYDEIKPKLDKLKEEEKAEALKVGRKEGIVAGKMLGLVEGELVGFDKGEVAGIDKRNIEIVKEMLNKNMDINLISELTKLTIEEIDALRRTE